MPAYCRICGSDNLRPSHFRIMDVVHLLFLRYPVRCRLCRHRGYVSISRISEVRREARARRRREAHERVTHSTVFVDIPRRGDDDLE